MQGAFSQSYYCKNIRSLLGYSALKSRHNSYYCILFFMSARPIILTGVFFLTGYFVIAQDYQHFFNEAKKALAEKRYQEFYTLIKKAHELHPYHQTILWYTGVAAALNDKPDEAISYLTRAININAGYNLDDPNLNAIRKHPGFQQLIQTKNKLNQAVIHSDTAYVVQDRQLHLESVAFDPDRKNNIWWQHSQTENNQDQ